MTKAVRFPPDSWRFVTTQPHGRLQTGGLVLPIFPPYSLIPGKGI